MKPDQSLSSGYRGQKLSNNRGAPTLLVNKNGMIAAREN